MNGPCPLPLSLITGCLIASHRGANCRFSGPMVGAVTTVQWRRVLAGTMRICRGRTRRPDMRGASDTRVLGRIGYGGAPAIGGTSEGRANATPSGELHGRQVALQTWGRTSHACRRPWSGGSLRDSVSVCQAVARSTPIVFASHDGQYDVNQLLASSQKHRRACVFELARGHEGRVTYRCWSRAGITESADQGVPRDVRIRRPQHPGTEFPPGLGARSHLGALGPSAGPELTRGPASTRWSRGWSAGRVCWNLSAYAVRIGQCHFITSRSASTKSL